jgi:hypothetical protein
MKKQLVDVSKGAGLLIVLLAMVFPPPVVFSAVLVLLLGLGTRLAFSGSHCSTRQSPLFSRGSLD